MNSWPHLYPLHHFHVFPRPIAPSTHFVFFIELPRGRRFLLFCLSVRVLHVRHMWYAWENSNTSMGFDFWVFWCGVFGNFLSVSSKLGAWLEVSVGWFGAKAITKFKLPKFTSNHPPSPSLLETLLKKSLKIPHQNTLKSKPKLVFELAHTCHICRIQMILNQKRNKKGGSSYL